MLLQQPRLGFTFSFQDRLMLHLSAFFGWLFNWKCKLSCSVISNIANHLKFNHFWDGDGIDDVTLRIWKFSDFCSRHTVSVAGDDIICHILVFVVVDMKNPWNLILLFICRWFETMEFLWYDSLNWRHNMSKTFVKGWPSLYKSITPVDSDSFFMLIIHTLTLQSMCVRGVGLSKDNINSLGGVYQYMLQFQRLL